MELNKITESDLSGKGVVGQPEVPGLSAEEMQAKVEEIVRGVAIVKINEIIDYLKENGCDSNEKSAEFIKSFVTGKSTKELEKEEAMGLINSSLNITNDASEVGHCANGDYRVNIYKIEEIDKES